MLRQVWQINGDLYRTIAAGDAVVALDDAWPRLIFVDAATGRIRARVPVPWHHGELRSTTDARGRPRVVLERGDDPKSERVYDPYGRLVWQSRKHGVRYVGGYAVAQVPCCDPNGYPNTGSVVVRDLGGHELTRQAGPSWVAEDFEMTDGPVVAVRPGWLALVDPGGDGDAAYLLDLTRPHDPRWLRLVPPRGTGHPTYTDNVAPVGGHLYVPWRSDHPDDTRVARYDVPGTRPVGHVSTVAGDEADDSVFGMSARADSGGRDDVVLLHSGQHVRLLDPHTGAWLGPWRGDYVTQLGGVSDGLAYLSDGEAIDVRTGKPAGSLTPSGVHFDFPPVVDRGLLILQTVLPSGLAAYRVSR